MSCSSMSVLIVNAALAPFATAQCDWDLLSDVVFGVDRFIGVKLFGGFFGHSSILLRPPPAGTREQR